VKSAESARAGGGSSHLDQPALPAPGPRPAVLPAPPALGSPPLLHPSGRGLGRLRRHALVVLLGAGLAHAGPGGVEARAAAGVAAAGALRRVRHQREAVHAGDRRLHRRVDGQEVVDCPRDVPLRPERIRLYEKAMLALSSPHSRLY
jgi:hypothetical protein